MACSLLCIRICAECNRCNIYICISCANIHELCCIIAVHFCTFSSKRSRRFQRIGMWINSNKFDIEYAVDARFPEKISEQFTHMEKRTLTRWMNKLIQPSANIRNWKFFCLFPCAWLSLALIGFTRSFVVNDLSVIKCNIIIIERWISPICLIAIYEYI